MSLNESHLQSPRPLSQPVISQFANDPPTLATPSLIGGLLFTWPCLSVHPCATSCVGDYGEVGLIGVPQGLVLTASPTSWTSYCRRPPALHNCLPHNPIVSHWYSTLSCAGGTGWLIVGSSVTATWTVGASFKYSMFVCKCVCVYVYVCGLFSFCVFVLACVYVVCVFLCVILQNIEGFR